MTGSEDYRFDLIHDAVGAEEEETAADREQQIRDRYAVAANPYGRTAIRDLLRLLDAERSKVARVDALLNRKRGGFVGVIDVRDALLDQPIQRHYQLSADA